MMKMKPYLTFAAALMVLPTAHLFAQTTGISNPDAVEDSVATPSTAGSHYTKPAALPAVAPTPNPFAARIPCCRDHAASPSVVYGAYKPYVPTTTAATSPAGTNDAAVVYDSYKPTAPSTKPAAFVANDDNSGIVKSGPLGANEPHHGNPAYGCPPASDLDQHHEGRCPLHGRSAGRHHPLRRRASAHRYRHPRPRHPLAGWTPRWYPTLHSPPDRHPQPSQRHRLQAGCRSHFPESPARLACDAGRHDRR